ALILDLIGELARDRGMATLLITHDLALAAERCDRIAVMHAGQLVELAPARALFAQPAHPFTRALIGATPEPSSVLGQLAGVPGLLPDLTRA
ncbi:ABC transporter ATP-binding protein, partial [Acinetobacter baumannii]